jgi:hypothetical protein
MMAALFGQLNGMDTVVVRQTRLRSQADKLSHGSRIRSIDSQP